MPIKSAVYRKMANLREKDLKLAETAKEKQKHVLPPIASSNKPRKISTPEIIDLVIKFAFLLYGRSLFSYQLPLSKKIVQSLLDNDGATLTGLFSRQSGKTELVGQIILACALLLPVLANQPAFINDSRLNRYWKDDLGNIKYSGFKAGMMIGIYAPIEEQATLAFTRVKECLVSQRAQTILADPDFQITFDTFNGQNIVMRGAGWTSLIGAYTASEGSSIEGKTYHLVIVDECLTGDSKILMANHSIKLLKDITVGDKTLGFEKNHFVEEEVLTKWNRGKKPVYKLITETGRSIKATENHKFLTNLGWLTTKEIVDKRVAFVAILLYIKDTQDAKDYKRISVGNFVRRCLSSIRGQEILPLSACYNRALVETKRIFNAQKSLIKSVLFVSFKKICESWMGGFCRQNIYTFSALLYRNAGNVLSQWKENCVYGMAQTAYSSFVGLLVHGRWKCFGRSKGHGFSNPFFFQARTPANNRLFSEDLQHKTCYCLRKTKEPFSSTFSFFGKEQIYSFNSTLCYSLNEIQTSRFGFTKNMQDLWYCVQGIQERCYSVWKAFMQKGKQAFIRFTSNGFKTERIDAYSLEPSEEETFDIETSITHTFIANGIIVHNCQDVSDYKISKSIIPFLAFNNGTMIQIGTPGLHVGSFYRNIEQNKNILAETKIRNHFEYDYLTVQKLNPQYAKFVAQQIVKLGVDSDEFRMNFKLEWLLDRGMFITESAFKACGKDYDIGNVLNEANQKIASIDWAKKIDRSVLTIAEILRDTGDPLNRPTKRIIFWAEWNGIKYQQQVYEIVNFLKLYGVKNIIADETGAGAMPTEMVESLLPSTCSVKKINFSKRQIMTDMWQQLSIEMLGGRFWFPNSVSAQAHECQRHFYQELLDLEKDTSKGYLTCHAPDLKGAHDDYADSCALLVYGVNDLEGDIVDLDMGDESAFASASIMGR